VKEHSHLFIKIAERREKERSNQGREGEDERERKDERERR
jgi:hypothetical protein